MKVQLGWGPVPRDTRAVRSPAPASPQPEAPVPAAAFAPPAQSAQPLSGTRPTAFQVHSEVCGTSVNTKCITLGCFLTCGLEIFSAFIPESLADCK